MNRSLRTRASCPHPARSAGLSGSQQPVVTR